MGDIRISARDASRYQSCANRGWRERSSTNCEIRERAAQLALDDNPRVSCKTAMELLAISPLPP